MMQIPLIATANQSLSIRLEDRRYEITIQATAGVMAATITRDETLLVQSLRCHPRAMLLPSYKEDDSGNFIFDTENGEYPDYTKFESTHALLYVSHAELETSRE
ncbi:hypothetical protein [Mycoavidus sp. SF9855]|uniref:phage baseplate plug family protein n=1 Tax=Mycoavidus sp. SF9855 TaxID=2968475 RepID=UPI00211C7AA6|nr:hypothetical protein [Mycoavidus sp. SF9855]UUM20925.1 hypothetical protein NQD60_05435 [Mycoavidus sp. SF9855]